MPQKWGFSPICDPKMSFKNQALSLLLPYGALRRKVLNKDQRRPGFSKIGTKYGLKLSEVRKIRTKKFI